MTARDEEVSGFEASRLDVMTLEARNETSPEPNGGLSPREQRFDGESPSTAPVWGRLRSLAAFDQAGARARSVPWALILTAGELLVLLVWTIVVTQPYLNLDSWIVPNGREFMHHIHPHHVWLRARECGMCALWNGSVRGGYPALADPQTSLLHPVVLLTTVGFGVVNGAKLSLAVAFGMAGLAQWWLAREVGVGRIARVWAACLAIAGGHLAGRMEHGIYPLVFSIAACSLVLAPMVRLSRTMSHRAAILLGVTGALAIVSGQGYMQLGVLFTLPAALFLLPRERAVLLVLGRRLVLAASVALLLSAPFLLPFLHFLPEFTKFSDAAYASAQPLAYVPLNLIIDDASFYTSTALQKLPFPWLYAYFIGWLPVLLAVWGAFRGGQWLEPRVLRYLIALALLSLWLASAIPFDWLATNLPFPWLAQQFASVRYPTLFTTLAVPPLLALAAVGLDHLLRARWPDVRLWFGARERDLWISLELRWLLVVPLVLAITSAQQFGRNWIFTVPLDDNLVEVIETMRTPDLQWVQMPFGEQYWIEPAIARGLKLSIGTQGWFWNNRATPEPVMEAGWGAPAAGMTAIAQVDTLAVAAAPPGREYAAVTHADGSRTICSARGTGGDINVRCDLPDAGTLRVQENNWSGWGARSPAGQLRLQDSNWLEVELPAGLHEVSFRYRPWDAPLGILLSLAGGALAWISWRRTEPNDFRTVIHGS